MGQVVQRVMFSVLLLCLLSSAVNAFAYEDPTSLYTTFIPDQWVYQAQQSTPLLIVFYGEGDYDLLYFEQLFEVPDQTSSVLAERFLELYAGPGGLKNYQLESPIQEILVAGLEGVSCAYTYDHPQGIKLWEYRVFLILPEKRGFSITLGGDENSVKEHYSILEEILAQWRWSF